MDFELKGSYLEKGNWRNFSRIVEANSEKRAKEKLFSLFGSEQKLARRNIKLEEVKKGTATEKKEKEINEETKVKEEK